MKNLKNIYKPMPERFHFAVESAVKEATTERRKSFCFGRVIKTVTVAVIVLALATTTVYGSAELYKLIVKSRGEYGVGLSADGQQNSPEYVKLIANPQGYVEMKGTEGLKFCKSENDRTADYSFLLIRPENGAEELYENVKDYKSLLINNREAVLMTGSGTMKMTRASVYFEEVNIILTCYANPEISEQEISDTLKGVQVVEGSASDHTSYRVSSDYLTSADVNMEYRYKVLQLKDSFEVYSDISASLSDIRVVDTACGLDKDDFYFWGEDVGEYIGSDGLLYPRISDVWSFGDGVNETDEFVKSEKMSQKLVLADVTYKNNSDTQYTFSIDWRLQYLEQSDLGKLSMADIYKSDRNIGDGLAQYIQNANSGKDYYVYTLQPGETATFTVGYLCDEVLLDNAYIVCERDSSNSLELSAVKVQNNG